MIFGLLRPYAPALAEQRSGVIVQRCSSHAEITGKLQRDFGEQKVGHGISGDGNLVEIYVASAGNFSVVKTTPRGVACIVDFGESWQTLHRLEVIGLTPD